MALINCGFCRVEYLADFKAIHIMFKGTVDSDEVIKLRNVLDSLSESLTFEKLVLDFTESTQVFIDYNSQIRKAFWKNLEDHGLRSILLIIPEENHIANARSSWESFYNTNRLDIGVSVIADRKLMPLFILNERFTTQLN